MMWKRSRAGLLLHGGGLGRVACSSSTSSPSRCVPDRGAALQPAAMRGVHHLSPSAFAVRHAGARRGLSVIKQASRRQPRRVRPLPGVRGHELAVPHGGRGRAQAAVRHGRHAGGGRAGRGAHRAAAHGPAAVVGPLAHAAGPHLRHQVHPHHRLGQRAPAHHLDLLLLRPAHPGAAGARRPVLPLRGRHRRLHVRDHLRHAGLVLRGRDGAAAADPGAHRLHPGRRGHERGEGDERGAEAKRGKRKGAGGPAAPLSRSMALLVLGGCSLLLCFYGYHSTYVSSMAYSSPSIVIDAGRRPDGQRVMYDDYREAYFWLRQNTDPMAKILSWWDYGYQMSAMANRTVLVDNNTWNNTHIATVGRALASSEAAAYPIFESLDVDYVLVIFGGLTGYSSDDINKFLWPVRIGSGVYPDDMPQERDFMNAQGQFDVGPQASATFKESVAYKTCYYRFGEVQTDYQKPPGFDRARGREVGDKNIVLETLEEAFTSEHWIVRIYKVKRRPELDATPAGQKELRAKAREVARGGQKEPELGPEPEYVGCFSDENMFQDGCTLAGHGR
ncbi:unnamed protein product [Heterosigma akashiwo]